MGRLTALALVLCLAGLLAPKVVTQGAAAGNTTNTTAPTPVKPVPKPVPKPSSPPVPVPVKKPPPVVAAVKNVTVTPVASPPPVSVVEPSDSAAQTTTSTDGQTSDLTDQGTSEEEYFDYEYTEASDYSAFEDENYFDWFAEDESDWTSSSVPREDYTYDLWQDDRCDGEDFGENATAPCELVVEGGAEAVKLKTPLAGVYKSTGCRNGRPLYKREKTNKDDEDRFIIFSGYWGDWDFSSKDQLKDEFTLGYGGEGDGERRPELVKPDDWYIRSTLVDQSNVTTDFVESLTLTAHCLDMCNDGLQNHNETGIDCGGPCPACQDLHLDELAERNSDLAKDLAALRMKIAAEQKAKEERDQENKVAKVAISFMIVMGAAIVLGGPIIYSLKRGRASGGVGPLYQQVSTEGGVAMGNRRHPV